MTFTVDPNPIHLDWSPGVKMWTVRRNGEVWGHFASAVAARLCVAYVAQRSRQPLAEAHRQACMMVGRSVLLATQSASKERYDDAGNHYGLAHAAASLAAAYERDLVR